MRILVADDARSMRESVCEILEPEGLEIIGEAADGSAAVEQFRRLGPEIVLLDLVMPRRSGLDALADIRAIDPMACVIVSCSLGQETLVEAALVGGAVDYVLKPFRPHDLLDAIDFVARTRFKPEL